MKRKVLFITALVMLFSTVCWTPEAISEEFSIRNGIHFGMSAKEVEEKEKDNKIGINPEHGVSDKLKDKYVGYMHCKNMFGVKYTNIVYRFKDDSLYLIFYDFIGENNEEAFSTLSGPLESKYGEPYYSGNTIKGLSVLTPGPVIDELSGFVDNSSPSMKRTAKFKQWIVPSDDYYVCITFALGRLEYAFGTSFSCELIYYMITNEDVEDALVNESVKYQEIYDSI